MGGLRWVIFAVPLLASAFLAFLTAAYVKVNLFSVAAGFDNTNENNVTRFILEQQGCGPSAQQFCADFYMQNIASHIGIITIQHCSTQGCTDREQGIAAFDLTYVVALSDLILESVLFMIAVFKGVSILKYGRIYESNTEIKFVHLWAYLMTLLCDISAQIVIILLGNKLSDTAAQLQGSGCIDFCNDDGVGFSSRLNIVEQNMDILILFASVEIAVCLLQLSVELARYKYGEIEDYNMVEVALVLINLTLTTFGFMCVHNAALASSSEMFSEHGAWRVKGAGYISADNLGIQDGEATFDALQEQINNATSFAFNVTEDVGGVHHIEIQSLEIPLFILLAGFFLFPATEEIDKVKRRRILSETNDV